MGKLTTHILDTMHGTPAASVTIDVSRLTGDSRVPLKRVTTNADGRVDGAVLEGDAFTEGRYELLFHIGDYFRGKGVALAEPAFLSEVPLVFGIADASQHFHVPLLASPYSYSTYRGS